MFICMSVGVFAWLVVCLPACIPICLSACGCICAIGCPAVWNSVCLPASVAAHLTADMVARRRAGPHAAARRLRHPRQYVRCASAVESTAENVLGFTDKKR